MIDTSIIGLELVEFFRTAFGLMRAAPSCPDFDLPKITYR